MDKSVAQPSAERLGSDSQSEEAATAEKAVLCLLRDACIATGAQAAAVFLQGEPRSLFRAMRHFFTLHLVQIPEPANSGSLRTKNPSKGESYVTFCSFQWMGAQPLEVQRAALAPSF